MNIPTAPDFDNPELEPEEPFGLDEVEMPDFDDDEDDLFAGIDPANIVTIRPSSGRPVHLIVDEPTQFSDLMQRASLTFNGQINMYVEGAQIDYSDLVQPGQTVTIIGNVKGGLIG